MTCWAKLLRRRYGCELRGTECVDTKRRDVCCLLVQFKEEIDGVQAATAIHYVLALGKHLESIDETRCV